MSTRTLVAELQLKASNWTAEGSRSIIGMLNRAQNFLFSKESRYSVYLDPTTGDYPFLTTVAGTLDYEMADITRTIEAVSRTLRIQDVIEIFSDNAVSTDYGIVNNPLFVGNVQGQVAKYNFIPTAALENTKARILFAADPGSSTAKYQYKALIEPLQLTSVSIPLMVPKDAERLLLEGALGYIEYFDYGRSDRMDKFEKEMAPKFWGEAQKRNLTRATRRTIRTRF